MSAWPRFRKVVTTADRLVAAATRDDRFYGGADSVAEVAATAPADEGDAGFLPKKKGDAGRRRHQLTSRAREPPIYGGQTDLTHARRRAFRIISDKL